MFLICFRHKGSCDGGRFVHNDIPELHKAMSEIAMKLNLKPHIVGKNNALICGPGGNYIWA